MVDFEPLYTTSRADTVAQFVAERYELALPLDLAATPADDAVAPVNDTSARE